MSEHTKEPWDSFCLMPNSCGIGNDCSKCEERRFEMMKSEIDKAERISAETRAVELLAAAEAVVSARNNMRNESDNCELHKAIDGLEAIIKAKAGGADSAIVQQVHSP